MKESVRIARFATIGTLNAIITALVIWLMMRSAGEHYTIANIVAYVVAQINNFIWSKYWIFPLHHTVEKKNNLWRQILYFSGAFAVAYITQFLFLILLVEVFDCNEYLAQFLGLFVYGAINFLANRHITFR